MTSTLPRWRLAGALACGATLAALAAPASAGFETLSTAGTKVLKTCNPTNAAGVTTCRVTSLPGETGYNLVASRTSPVEINGVVVGTQTERVWRHCTDTTLYIFGVRLQMNTAQWDGSGAPFAVNDVFKQGRTDKGVAVAYFNGSPAAAQALASAGRTFAGLNEYEEAQPPRDLAWTGFRVRADAGAAPAGSAYTPWLLTRTRAPEGYAIQDFALRLLNSADESVDQNSIYSAGYQPVCTSDDCAPADDE